MAITVNNRELLRNYKSLKEKLIKGQIDQVSIPQGNGVVIKMRVETPETVAKQWLKKVKKMPPIYIDRPKEDLF